MTTIRAAKLIPVSASGDLRRGGWLVNGRVEGDTDAVQAGLNWRIMGVCDSGWSDPEHREAFNLHVLANPDFSATRYSSLANFQAGTANALMGGQLQDISFTEQASPANDHQMTGLNIGKIVQHILQKHCNFLYDATGAAGAPDGIITATTIDTTNSTTVEIYNVSQSDNLWRVIQQIAGMDDGGEFYYPYFNRHNEFFYRQAPSFLSPAATAKGTLDKTLIRGTIQVKFVNNQPAEKLGQVKIVAVKNSTTVYDAAYPADPEDGKIFKLESGVWADDQARADLLAERLYKWKTRLYTLQVEVDAGLALWGDDGNGLDIGDRILVTYNGPAEDALTGAGVHLALSAQSMFVYGIDLSYDLAGRAGKATLTLEYDNA